MPRLEQPDQKYNDKKQIKCNPPAHTKSLCNHCSDGSTSYFPLSHFPLLDRPASSCHLAAAFPDHLCPSTFVPCLDTVPPVWDDEKAKALFVITNCMCMAEWAVAQPLEMTHNPPDRGSHGCVDKVPPCFKVQFKPATNQPLENARLRSSSSSASSFFSRSGGQALNVRAQVQNLGETIMQTSEPWVCCIPSWW